MRKRGAKCSRVRGVVRKALRLEVARQAGDILLVAISIQISQKALNGYIYENEGIFLHQLKSSMTIVEMAVTPHCSRNVLPKAVRLWGIL
jgi:hypothetical protein